MDNNDLLELFKLQLGVRNTLRDKLFESVLNASILELERKGITLADTVDDTMLIIDYASYNYLKRTENVDMPKNLNLRIKNRIMRARSGGNE